MLLKLSIDQKTLVSVTPTESAPSSLIIDNDTNIDTLACRLDEAPVIELHFPAYKDGRAYTQARQLRENHVFSGDLRATGDIVADQIPAMIRCGFTSFEPASPISIDVANQILREFSHYYQHTSASPVPIWQLRSQRQSAQSQSA